MILNHHPTKCLGSVQFSEHHLSILGTGVIVPK